MAGTLNTSEEVYDFIGELAIALYSKKIQISLGSLRSILADRGKDYNNNRGMATGVSAAYRRWKDKDPVVLHGQGRQPCLGQGRLSGLRRLMPAGKKEKLQ